MLAGIDEHVSADFIGDLLILALVSVAGD